MPKRPYDVTCPLCGAKPGEQCVTKTGKVYPHGHMARWKVKPSEQPKPKPKPKPSIAERLRLALWYIDKAGDEAYEMFHDAWELVKMKESKRIDLDWQMTAHFVGRPLGPTYRVNFSKQKFYVLCDNDEQVKEVQAWIAQKDSDVQMSQKQHENT